MSRHRMASAGIFCLVFAIPGCAEFVHMGQISDQNYGSGINDVKIEQQRKDGSWHQLDKTDGRGKYWIMKKDIKSGQQIRFTKPGYFPSQMWDSDFLQEVNFQMVPSEGGDELGNRTDPFEDPAEGDRR